MEGRKKKPAPGAAAAAAGATAAAAPAVCLNGAHTSPAAVARYTRAFRAGTPFPHLALHDVFPDAALQQVRRELLGGAFHQKRNDLYDFQQSDDLRQLRGSAVAALRQYLYSPGFRAWISGVTGVPVNDTVDVSAASYTEGSYLLCHDDDLSERRIAYIVYLVPEAWGAADGGALDLFALAPPGADPTVPGAVARSLTPRWNSMAFFEVTASSHHQVAEVTDAAKGPRLSISGWFHGPPLPRPPMAALPAPVFIQPAAAAPPLRPAAGAGAGALSNASLPDGSGDALAEWVNPAYLRPAVQAQMRAQFARDASLEVRGFLREGAYLGVMRALGAQRWRVRGPPNVAHYRACYDTGGLGEPGGGAGDERGGGGGGSGSGGGDGGGDGASSSSGGGSGGGGGGGADRFNGAMLPDAVHRLWRFVTGRAFQALVGCLTGSALAGGLLAGELRCFTSGDYTMVVDPQYREALVAAKRQRVGDAAGATEVAAAAAAGAAVAVAAGGAAAAAASAAVAAAGGGHAPVAAGGGKRKRDAAVVDDPRRSDAGASAPSDVGAASALPLLPPPGSSFVDATLFCVVADEWGEEAGGYTSYLTADDELLSVMPGQNRLVLVQREPQVMSFVKYLNAQASENRYDVALQFAVCGEGGGGG